MENRELEAARKIVEETSANLFLTGKAGTGKTTFLRSIVQNSRKRLMVAAPTGIAAINAGGVTLHSFFQLPFGPYLPGALQTDGKRRYDRFSKEKLRIIRTLDLLIIDEISMVRADLLDALDATLRRHRDPMLPFGGVQLLLIGDLSQLAPVVKPDEWSMLENIYSTPYFFSSKALEQTSYLTIELTQVFRQRDTEFVRLLNAIRTNTTTPDDLRKLNERYLPGNVSADMKGYIRLTTHNAKADRINMEQLARLTTNQVRFKAVTEGNFPESSYPNDPELLLKQGAQVMFLRNDPSGEYFNGLMGTVVSTDNHSVRVRPFDSEREIEVTPVKWENIKYTLDEQNGSITQSVDGTYSQLPLKTAWAITVHKSQGLTFDKAIIDVSGSFAHGQTYVALSRCRSLEGLYLEQPLSKSAIITDSNVAQFTEHHVTGIPTEEQMSLMMREFYYHQLDDMFNMRRLRLAFDKLRRIIDEYLFRTYPSLPDKYRSADTALRDNLETVAENFRKQYTTLQPGTSLINQRIAKGAEYFHQHLASLLSLIQSTPQQADNKAWQERLQVAHAEISDLLNLRMALMKATAEAGDFTPTKYLAKKAELLLSQEEPTKKKKREKKERNSTENKAVITDDIVNPEIYERLVKWRFAEAKRMEVPAFVIFANRDLINIAAALPLSMNDLTLIKGVGKVKANRYGAQVLEIIAEALKEGVSK